VKKHQKLTKNQQSELAAFIEDTAHKSAEVRRAQAVLLVDAESPVAIIHSLTRYSLRRAQELRNTYLAAGVDALTDHRRSNHDRVLTRPERQQVTEALKTKQPKEVLVTCNAEQWSTYWLGEYIRHVTGKTYKSKTSHYVLFREARLTFHRPGRVYEKSSSEATVAWVKQQSDGRSRLMRAWRDPNTVILCEDEMVLTSATTIQKVWLTQGEYPPVVETNRSRVRKSVYGFLNLKTGTEHAFITDYQNMFITAEVLTKLRAQYPDKELLLLWDNCGWHRGSKAMEWIKRDKRTRVIWFPPYTPELNPQEHVWKAGRAAVTHNQHVTDIGVTVQVFVDHITSRIFPYELCGLRADLGAI